MKFLHKISRPVFTDKEKLTNFAKSSIVDVRLSSKFASDQHTNLVLLLQLCACRVRVKSPKA